MQLGTVLETRTTEPHFLTDQPKSLHLLINLVTNLVYTDIVYKD